jgi:hypothetical protein
MILTRSLRPTFDSDVSASAIASAAAPASMPHPQTASCSRSMIAAPENFVRKIEGRSPCSCFRPPCSCFRYPCSCFRSPSSCFRYPCSCFRSYRWTCALERASLPRAAPERSEAPRARSCCASGVGPALRAQPDCAGRRSDKSLKEISKAALAVALEFEFDLDSLSAAFLAPLPSSRRHLPHHLPTLSFVQKPHNATKVAVRDSQRSCLFTRRRRNPATDNRELATDN